MSAKGWEIRRLQVNPQSRTVEKDTIPIPTGLKIVTRGAVSNHHTAIHAVFFIRDKVIFQLVLSLN